MGVIDNVKSLFRLIRRILRKKKLRKELMHEFLSAGLPRARINELLTALSIFLGNPNYETLKKTLDLYPHPPKTGFDQYIQATNPSASRTDHRIQNVNFSVYDDKILESFIPFKDEKKRGKIVFLGKKVRENCFLPLIFEGKKFS